MQLAVSVQIPGMIREDVVITDRLHDRNLWGSWRRVRVYRYSKNLVCYKSLHVLVDTEGSFVVDRVKDMGEAVVSWIKDVAAQEEEDEGEQRREALEKFTLESILSHIHYYRVHDYIEQIVLLNILPAFLKEHPSVPLLPSFSPL